MTLHYGWKPKSVFPYESLWSLLQKFITWNVCTPIELWQCFNRTHYAYPTGEKNILKATFIDVSKFKKGLNLTEEQIATSQLPYFLDHDELEILSPNSLRYCQQCLEEGYHSTIQQLLFIEACPHHRTPFTDSCPWCLQPICLSFNATTLNHPFKCPNCNHPLVDLDNQLDCPSRPQRDNAYAEVAGWLLKRKNFPRVDRPRTSEWLGKGMSAARKRARVRTLPILWSKMLGSNAPFDIPNNTLKLENYTFKFNKLSSSNANNDAYLKVLGQIFEFLASHRRCIEKIVKMWWPDIYYVKPLESPICIYAQAFVLWRMYCENIDRPHSLKNINSTDAITRLHVCDLFEQELTCEVREEQLIAQFWECVALSRLWRRQKLMRFDVRHIQSKYFPYWYRRNSPKSSGIDLVVWTERITRLKTLETSCLRQ